MTRYESAWRRTRNSVSVSGISKKLLHKVKRRLDPFFYISKKLLHKVKRRLDPFFIARSVRHNSDEQERKDPNVLKKVH